MRTPRIGRVERRIRRLLSEEGALHFSLIDPDKSSPEEASDLALQLEDYGTSGFLIGGSTGVSESQLDRVVRGVKRSVKAPVILFPGNITGISRYADAIFFMSLLNSDDPYFITGAQLLGSIIVKRYGLEAIPTGYVIVGEGGVAGYIGRARPVPEDKPEIVALYALTATMLGMRFVYLEKGSGASKPVSLEAVRAAKKLSPSTVLVVGGGVREAEQARKLVEAGADIVVTGTLIERGSEKIKDVIRAVAEAGSKRVQA